MAEIAERHFIKVSKRRNREHELLRARITKTTYERQGRQEIEAVEKSARFPLSWCHVFLHRLRVVSIFFSRREHSIIFPSTIQNSSWQRIRLP